jgi:hypothetical protein
MHKLLYFATIGLLAFSIGGCGGEGSNTASPSPSPSAPSPSPAASASPTPAAQTFQSPIVAAQPPGLIRSTNPDERARQAQTGIGDNKNRNPTQSLPPVPIGPLTANPSQADPFGPLPPIALQIPSGAANAGAGMTCSTPQTATARSSRATQTAPSGSPPNWSARSRYRSHFFSRRHRGTSWLVAPSSAAKYSSGQSRRHRGATWLAAPNSGAKCSSVRSSSYLPAWTRTHCS